MTPDLPALIADLEGPNNEVEWCGEGGLFERAAAALRALSAEVEGLRNDAADMVAGLRYVRRNYGSLDGVGWDRVDALHQRLHPHPTLPPPPATEAGK